MLAVQAAKLARMLRQWDMLLLMASRGHERRANMKPLNHIEAKKVIDLAKEDQLPIGRNIFNCLCCNDAGSITNNDRSTPSIINPNLGQVGVPIHQ